MLTKVGESTGKPLYSMDGRAWYSTREAAIKVHEVKQDLERREKATRSTA